MFLRSGFPFNYDTNQASDDSSLMCMDESLAKDSMREETDINTIVRRFGISGQLPQGVRAPTYGDFTGIFDFASAMQVIRDATESFMFMPADVRVRFHNDPQEFVEFCSNPVNRDEAIRLGLVDLPPAPPPAEPAGAAVAAPKAPGEAPSPGVKAPV